MAVPVIDIAGERPRVVEEVGRACREIGFLTVVGHGVSEELVAATAAAARAFFDLPEDENDHSSRVINYPAPMARWTNDRWTATLHRVAVPPPDRRLGSRRQTIVFFHDPRADAVIECIPGCADESNPPRYEPVTALEHVNAKAAAAQSS